MKNLQKPGIRQEATSKTDSVDIIEQGGQNRINNDCVEEQRTVIHKEYD